ncbi:MAG: transcription termination/antitermination protein NusA [Chloroflexi bacterium]|nr:transcription termination/antitermination protein NusA [Chloroflexota bacterium]
MKKEFALAFNELLDDKQLPKEVIIEALEAAMVSAYRKTVNASTAQEIVGKLDNETGDILIFAEKEVVEEVQDENTEVTLETARKEHPEAELGEVLIVESTPEDFGRVAAQTARQVVQQRIREAERDAQMEYFGHQVGETVNGIVQAANPHMITLGLDRKAEGKMPRSQQIPGERFRVHDRVRALLLEVKDSPRGPEIILTRAHRDFLRRLLEDEVPEIYQGLVEIRSIAREPGYRSKVAVSALQAGIDPVGACVGIRGVRIQAIVRELHDEKIDVIEWNSDPAQFIAKSLSPARVTGVYLDDRLTGNRTATVVVPEDQLSLAIGRDGQNARLAAKLTGWRIDIKSLPEATGDAVNKLQTHDAFAPLRPEMDELVPQIEGVLAKKAEGRPITPEEYKLLGDFVNKIEFNAQERREEILEQKREEREKVAEKIPSTAFDLPVEELGLTPSLTLMVAGEGYTTIGELMMQLELDADKILEISGVGPKAIESIQETIAGFEFPEPEPEPEVEAEADAEEAAEMLDEASADAAIEAVEEAEVVDTELKAATDDVVVLPKMKKEKAEATAETSADGDEEPQSVEEIFAKTAEQLLGKQRRAKPKAAPKAAEPAVEEADKKKKRKKGREIEYDPDHDVTIVRRRREDEWEEGGEW